MNSDSERYEYDEEQFNKLDASERKELGSLTDAEISELARLEIKNGLGYN